MTLDQKFKTLESVLGMAAMASSARLCFSDAAELYASKRDGDASRRLEQAAQYVWGVGRPEGWK